jgi:cytochrome P450
MTALHDDINELVEQRLRQALETGETVNVPDLASEMTESLADLVVCGAPLEEQPRLIAYSSSNLAGSLKRSARLAWVCSDSSFGDVSKHQ